MNDTRIELLREYVKQEPDDPFNWYALAMEEQKHNAQRAEEIYLHLLNAFPEYVPTYYQGGLFYLESGKLDKALEILRTGLIKCESQKNTKTRNEIQSLIMELEDDL